jgi:hypothetical protein
LAQGEHKVPRAGALDGATFPHIIKVKYTVDGKDYIKYKWLPARIAAPKNGDTLRVIYNAEKPKKAKIILSGV